MVYLMVCIGFHLFSRVSPARVRCLLSNHPNIVEVSQLVLCLAFPHKIATLIAHLIFVA